MDKEVKSINCLGQITGVKNKLRKIEDKIIPFKVIEVSIPVHIGKLTDEHRLLADSFFESGCAVNVSIGQSQKDLFS